MLKQETKKRIDSARQILVGKVPDPKAQVEQITIAIIYKFMDDMDKESEELGGKARFFTNGYEKYSWTKIMDLRLGGHERTNLYVEAITKMSQNPHIPQLFRDIFKGAFLPYRDPDTLNLFLKEVNSFEYEHSEDLGDAFEYLLSVLGSQGDAGQFRTPRHIIDFIVEIIKPQKDETILDPACGTGGFLISAYKHIIKNNDGKDNITGTPTKQEKPLTPDEKTKLMRNIVGYDISPDMVKLSLVNMYLHKFPEPQIYEYDSLTSDDKWNETFDVVLANPPFMTPKGGIRPHKKFMVQANRAEVLFVDYIVEHLNINGRAGIIVPEGVVSNTNAQYYKNLRKLLIDDYLYGVVHLHNNVFLPYADVNTSVLLLDKSIAKKTEKILFIDIENDGFTKGSVKRISNKNDIPFALDLLGEYKKAIIGNKKNIKEHKDVSHSFVNKKEILEDPWYILLKSRYNKVVNGSKYKFEKLGKYIEERKVKSGDKELPVWSVSNEKGFILSEQYFNKRVASENTKNYKIVKPNYFAYNPARINVGSIALNNLEETGIVSPMYVVFEVMGDKLLSNYLLYLLKSDIGNQLIKDRTKGAVRKTLKFDDLGSIEVPMPSIEEQQKITELLEKNDKLQNEIEINNSLINNKIKQFWGG